MDLFLIFYPSVPYYIENNIISPSLRTNPQNIQVLLLVVVGFLFVSFCFLQGHIVSQAP